MKARWLIGMGLLASLGAKPGLAGPWSVEPRLGVTTEYDTNPLLNEFDTRAEDHVAAIADVPLRYDADAVEFLFRPTGRFSNSHGYSSLASNYAHLDADLQLSNELGVTTLDASLARDSSLYYAGALVNGLGVRRDTSGLSADWNRLLTERLQADVMASATEVHYQESADLRSLVDYRYLSLGPTLSYSLTERDTVKLLGTAGRYQSLNGITESQSENLQLGYVRLLTEVWTLSVNAGYSRSKNSEKIFFGPFYLGQYDSNQDGTVYSASATHRGERLTVTAGASRALQPTGFAYLSRQDSLNVNGTYTASERWDYALAATWQRQRNPLIEPRGTISTGNEQAVQYLNAVWTANFHWSPTWTLSLHATRVAQQYGVPRVSGASSGISIDLVKQFLRVQF